MEDQSQVLVAPVSQEQGEPVEENRKDNRAKTDGCCTECRKHPALCVGKDQQSHQAESAKYRPDKKKCPDSTICEKQTHG